MFKVGKTYKIKMWESGSQSGGETEYYNCEVIEVQLPLIRVRQWDKEKIINTGSLAFVSAEIQST